MPALPPSEFVAKATERGFVFSVKPDGSLGVRPPTSGAMTDSMRRYVSAMKLELLALLSGTPTPTATGERSEETTDRKGQKRADDDDRKGAKRRDETEHQCSEEGREKAEKGGMQEAEKEPQKASKSLLDADAHQGQMSQNVAKCHTFLTEQEGAATLPAALYPAGDRRQELLDWVGRMTVRGGLPLPSEPIKLPSGKSAPADEAAIDWWLETYDKAALSRSEAMRADLLHVARWFAEAWRYQKAPELHRGAACSIGDARGGGD